MFDGLVNEVLVFDCKMDKIAAKDKIVLKDPMDDIFLAVYWIGVQGGFGFTKDVEEEMGF